MRVTRIEFRYVYNSRRSQKQTYEIAITRSLRKLEENPGRRNILIKSNRITVTKLRQVQSQILKHSDSVTARSLNRSVRFSLRFERSDKKKRPREDTKFW